jgi:hypothetical protein
MTTFASLFLMVSAVATASPPMADGLSAIQIFKAACVDGKIGLRPDKVEQVSFRSLPKGAKAVMGLAMSRPPADMLHPQLPTDSDVPNPIFLIRGKPDIYFISVTPQAESRAQLADSCMVIWKSFDFEKARNFLTPNAPFEHRSSIPGFGYVVTDDGAYVLTGAGLNGWTLMKSELSASGTSSPSFPGAENQ